MNEVIVPLTNVVSVNATSAELLVKQCKTASIQTLKQGVTTAHIYQGISFGTWKNINIVIGDIRTLQEITCAYIEGLKITPIDMSALMGCSIGLTPSTEWTQEQHVIDFFSLLKSFGQKICFLMYCASDNRTNKIIEHHKMFVKQENSYLQDLQTLQLSGGIRGLSPSLIASLRGAHVTQAMASIAIPDLMEHVDRLENIGIPPKYVLASIKAERILAEKKKTAKKKRWTRF